MKKILVTGAAGFIGFHLVERLVFEGYEVFGIDNMNGYYDVNLKYARLTESGINIKKNKNKSETIKSDKYFNYSFAKIDITDIKKLEDLFKIEKFSHVVNLAAQAGVRYSIENPHVYVQSNLVGFLNILECCRHYKIKHLVYASSSSVYGANSKIPFSEEDKVDNPVSLYAATKKSNELMAHTYSHLYNLPTTGLRFFTVYGPWGRPDMSPILFADAIKKGEPLKVFNNGEMERDFTYVDDIVYGTSMVLQSVPKGNQKYRVLNIGNGNPVNLMRFIKTIENAYGKLAIKTMMPMQPGDVKRTWADTTKIDAIASYKEKKTIEEGVKKFINWYKDYFN